MTKKDFFILSIKLFGLYSIVTSLFSQLVQNILFVTGAFDFKTIFTVILMNGILLGLFLLLIFRAEKIVQILKLENGFDEDRIDFGSLTSLGVLKVGIFIIGGLLIVDYLPSFLNQLYEKVKPKDEFFPSSMQDNFKFIVSAVNLIVGYLLVTKFNFIANFIKSKTHN